MNLYQWLAAPHIPVVNTKSTGYLAKHQVLGAALKGELRVTCESGLLWVTAPDSGDLLIGGGVSVRLCGRGKVVLQALEPAHFRLEPVQLAAD